jgi:signal transduction histidine kinase
VTIRSVPGESTDSPGTFPLGAPSFGAFAKNHPEGIDADGCRAIASAIENWLSGVGGVGDKPSQAERCVHSAGCAESLTLGAAGLSGGSGAGELLRAIDHLATALRSERDRVDRSIRVARMELARELAYGAGHEINNPLANIAARGQALLADEPIEHRRRRLAEIVDQAFRARDMIGSLMVFAKPPRPSPSRVRVGAMMARVVEAVRRRWPADDAGPGGVQILIEEAGDEASAIPQAADGAEEVVGEWDPAQIEEAIASLLQNAVEAADSTVRVRWGCHPAGPSECLIEIADDGPGIPAEARHRIFDPFFSGREAGRGLGLGLSKAWMLIEINGGRVEVRHGSASPRGAERTGACMLVRLPCRSGGG